MSERKPRKYGYFIKYKHESQASCDAVIEQLYPLVDLIFYDERGMDTNLHQQIRDPFADGNTRPHLKALVNALLPGDEVLVPSLDRLGFREIEFSACCNALYMAKIRFLDVEKLYGDEEPPCLWFADQLGSKLFALRKAVLAARGNPDKWHGPGWKRFVNKSGSVSWKVDNTMRAIGARIVDYRDNKGSRWDTIAKVLNADCIRYKDCTAYSWRLWTEKLVSEFYKACRAGWPAPKKIKKKRIADIERVESVPLPPKNPNAGRPLRERDKQFFANKRAEAKKSGPSPAGSDPLPPTS